MEIVETVAAAGQRLGDVVGSDTTVMAQLRTVLGKPKGAEIGAITIPTGGYQAYEAKISRLLGIDPTSTEAQITEALRTRNPATIIKQIARGFGLDNPDNDRTIDTLVADIRAAAAAAAPAGGGAPDPRIAQLQNLVGLLPPHRPTAYTEAELANAIAALPAVAAIVDANAMDIFRDIKGIFTTIHARQLAIDNYNAQIAAAMGLRAGIVRDAGAGPAPAGLPDVPDPIPDAEFTSETIRKRLAYMKQVVNDPGKQGTLNGADAGGKTDTVKIIRTALTADIPVDVVAPATTADLQMNAALTQFGGRRARTARRRRANQKTQRRRRVRFGSK